MLASSGYLDPWLTHIHTSTNLVPAYNTIWSTFSRTYLCNAARFGTVEGVIRGSCLDSDDNFTTQAEFLLGEELLREL
jgi:hypothetical protein